MMLRWRPTYPMRTPDRIISSDCRLRNDLVGFIPTYESKPHVNMNFLMSNEYYRMWFKERQKYEKITYAMLDTLRVESNIKRRFVQRDLSKREKIKAIPIIKPQIKSARKIENKNKKP